MLSRILGPVRGRFAAVATIRVGVLGDRHIGTYRVYDFEPEDCFSPGFLRSGNTAAFFNCAQDALRQVEDDVVEFLRLLDPVPVSRRLSSELRCLAYVSTCSKALEQSDLLTLRNAAAKRNEEYGVTGLLVLDDDHFMQYLEGPAAHLELIYWIIRHDKMHYGLVDLFRRPLGKRALQRWSLAFDAGPRDRWAAGHGVVPGIAALPEGSVKAMFMDFVRR